MPGSATAQIPTLPQGNAPSQAATMSVRLVSPGGSLEPGQSLWQSTAPAACLAIDVIVAAGGEPGDARGDVLQASFPSFPAAISAARRLQWAVQGFAEAENLRETSTAVLIQPALAAIGPPASDPLRRELENASPGQILLADAVCKSVEDLPGFAMRKAAESGLRELAWRAPENQSTRAFDEQVLGRVMEQRGLESFGPPVAEAAVSGPAAEAESRVSARRSRETGGHSSPSRGKLAWLAGAGCLAVLALAGVLGLRMFGGKSKPFQPEEPHSTPAVSPSSLGGSASTVAPLSPGDSLPAAAQPSVQAPHNEPAQRSQPSKRQQPAETAVVRVEKVDETPKAAQPPPKSVEVSNRGCDLDRNQLPDEIVQAEKSLARGKYRDAQRQFGSVLACDAGNSRAREGLERVREAIAAGGSSTPQ